MSANPSQKMLVIEINEAERYFLEKFVNEGYLPEFQKLLSKGRFIETRINTWDASKDKAWRHISPWIVWPSVYTGFKPEEHGMIGFGQDPSILVGNCIWDKLNQRGITTGVMSNLMSYPVRENEYSLFYIPEALASTADCLPKTLEPIQDFLIYTARNYSESFLTTSVQATYKLLKSVKAGLPVNIAGQLLAQVPLELMKGPSFQRNRALIQAKLQMALFDKLYNKYKPAFATVHMNHIAYMQHRYWRAAEPEKFKDELGHLDQYYYGSIKNRKKYEKKLQHAILDGFKLTDKFLSKLMPQLDSNTLLVIMSGLGQKRMDPTNEIHNPEIRLLQLDKLLKYVSVINCKIYTQMNPDITLDFNSEAEAAAAQKKIEKLLVLGTHPLFHVQQVKHQLFLEGFLPSTVWPLGKKAWISRQGDSEKLPLFDYVRVGRAKDQSTAHHRDNGWILLYGNEQLIPNISEKRSIDITEVSSLLLSYFN